jgi:hypothetical protein
VDVVVDVDVDVDVDERDRGLLSAHGDSMF